MTIRERSFVPFLAAAWLCASASPLLAAGFDAFLARFAELKPPAALDEAAMSRKGNGIIPIEEFESFVLAPAHALAASRPGLRSLGEWPARIRERRRYEGHPREGEDYRLSFQPIGRWKAGDVLLLAMYCEANHDWEDGGEVAACRYLLSFTPSGKLIDGHRFAQSNYDPPLIASDGSPSLDRAALSADGAGRIAALDTYGAYDDKYRLIVGEAWSWGIDVSTEGVFAESHLKRRFLLSKVYAESGESPGRLFVYETEARAKEDPLFFDWDKEGPRVRAETEGAPPASGSIAALEAAGRKLAVSFSADGETADLLDPAGKPRALALAYGPGAAGEPTRMSGVSLLGDIYERRSETWTYLFAEASLPAGSAGRRATFKARSFVIGTIAEGSGGSTDDVVAFGALKDGDGVGRTLSKDASKPEDPYRGYRAGIGSVAFPAGTRIGFSVGSGNQYPWAVVSKETTISLPGQKVKAPAGSRLDFYPGNAIKSASFPVPVKIRVGASEASIFEAELNAISPQGFERVALAAPYAAMIAGKKVSLTDSLSFDEKGVLQSGRLTADAEFAAGGRSYVLRGGYDPEWPEAGIVGFYPGGALLSGTLAKRMEIQTANVALTLVEGDALTLNKDGSFRSLMPIGMIRSILGGKKMTIKPISIEFNSDNSVSMQSSTGELEIAKGKLAVSALEAACNDMRVRVRAEPNLEAPTLGYLNKGDRLVVLDKGSYPMGIEDANEYWYRVRRASDGLIGWSYGQFLKLDE
jgi:hypothetical protein